MSEGGMNYAPPCIQVNVITNRNCRYAHAVFTFLQKAKTPPDRYWGCLTHSSLDSYCLWNLEGFCHLQEVLGNGALERRSTHILEKSPCCLVPIFFRHRAPSMEKHWHAILK